VTGFHVACVHSIRLWSATGEMIGRPTLCHLRPSLDIDGYASDE
jgi:hypothetical protein